MQDHEIMELAVRLEASLIPDEGIVRSDSHIDEQFKQQVGNYRFHTTGNRTGYLRLAIVFLRAALQPLKDADTAIVDVPMPHKDISVFDYEWLERREDVEREVEPESYVETWRDKASSFMMSVVLALLCLFLIIGFFCRPLGVLAFENFIGVIT